MKKKRMLTSLLLSFIFILGISFNVSAKEDIKRDISVWINGNYILSDVQPFVKNDRTFVPLRFISSELGYNVKWNPEDKSVTVSKSNNNMIFKVNSDICTVNGYERKIDAPVYLINNRTFLPLRFVAENFGENVSYDEECKTAVIGKDYKNDSYYKIKYYSGNNDPVTTDYSLNLLKMNIDTGEKVAIALRNYDELYSGVKDNIINDFIAAIKNNGGVIDESITDPAPKVNSDKSKLKDEYYVPADSKDSRVGSWYADIWSEEIKGYLNDYIYVKKNGNDYTIKHRMIIPDGSEIITNSKGYFKDGVLYCEDSYETEKATGAFNGNWKTFATKFGFKDNNIMYNIKEPNVVLEKF